MRDILFSYRAGMWSIQAKLYFSDIQFCYDMEKKKQQQQKTKTIPARNGRKKVYGRFNSLSVYSYAAELHTERELSQ